MIEVFDELKGYCPSGFVTRKELQKLTGGLISSRTIANLDSSGVGIKNRTVIGSKVVYKIDDVIEWLQANTKLINFDKEEEK
ncbi:MAG: hypothetical protein IJA14_03450 [Alphaproteobacteria bacterium]|nr:hypothetical protein [Alphaproteobacteria bacterium]